MDIVLMARPSTHGRHPIQLLTLETGLAGSTTYCQQLAMDWATKYGLRAQTPPIEDDFSE